MESPSNICNLTLYLNDSASLPSFDMDYDYCDWYKFYDTMEHPDEDTDFDKFMKYRKIRRIVYGLVLILMIIAGMVGNVLVVFSSCRRSRQSDSALYVFLVNLCIASMVLLGIEFPILLYEHVFSQPWKLGLFFCQLHGYVQHCATYGTTYALVALLLFGVLQATIPNRIVMMNNTCAASVICSIMWALIMIANIPIWIGHGLYVEIEGRSFCYHKQLNDSRDRLHQFLIIYFFFAFAFPCVMMVAMVTVFVLKALHINMGSQYRNINNAHHLQKHTAIMLIGLVIGFILCWGPTSIFFLLIGFELVDFSNFLLLSIIGDVFMSMACANPFINPWIILTTRRHELLPGHCRSVSVTIPHNHCLGQNDNGSLVSNGNIFDGENQQDDSLESSATEMKLV